MWPILQPLQPHPRSFAPVSINSQVSFLATFRLSPTPPASIPQPYRHPSPPLSPYPSLSYLQPVGLGTHVEHLFGQIGVLLDQQPDGRDPSVTGRLRDVVHSVTPLVRVQDCNHDVPVRETRDGEGTVKVRKMCPFDRKTYGVGRPDSRLSCVKLRQTAGRTIPLAVHSCLLRV